MYVDHFSWRETWRENTAQMSRVSDTKYWNKRAEDYADFIRTSQFGYGEEIARILSLEKVIRSQDSVLEIAGGVGALTLPLARRSRRVLTIEPAKSMARRLIQNADEYGISNIDIDICTQEQFAEKATPKSVDLAILCHAAWQFPDIEKLLAFMERVSRRYCCLADTVAHVDSPHQDMYTKLDIKESAFDRVFHLYNILCKKGGRPCISFFKYQMRRSTESAMSMWTHLVGKYRTINTKDIELIDEHLLAHAHDGIYEEPGFMAVMWWKSKEGEI